jgi:5-(carboxyamino)imidazole ribonucleotide synthase
MPNQNPTDSTPRIAPRIGIIGGGQLARMTALAGVPLGCEFSILEKNPNSPAAKLASHVAIGDWDNPATLLAFAPAVEVITLENEFVSADSLAAAEAAGHRVYPRAATIALVQDKLVQKQTFAKAGLPVAPFASVNAREDLPEIGREFGWPFVLKARRNGYDGKGNWTVREPGGIAEAWEKLRGDRNALYAEKYCPFTDELAVIVTRSINGEMATYPLVQSVQKNHICHEVRAPARVAPEIERRALEIAQAAVLAADGFGSFGIELFLLGDGSVVLNEIAPRVHNSGHYTIEACECSQFENHVRAILGWPLGSTRMRAPHAVMVNLLGQEAGPAHANGLSAALQVAGAHVHIYGKSRAETGRKMGHLTVLGSDPEETLLLARQAASRLRFGDKR